MGYALDVLGYNVQFKAFKEVERLIDYGTNYLGVQRKWVNLSLVDSI